MFLAVWKESSVEQEEPLEVESSILHVPPARNLALGPRHESSRLSSSSGRRRRWLSRRSILGVNVPVIVG